MLLRVGCFIAAFVLSWVSAKPGFLVTAPQVLHTGTDEQICFTFVDLDNVDLIANINLTSRQSIFPFEAENDDAIETTEVSVDKEFAKGEGKCMSINIPDHLPYNDRRYYYLRVSGRSLGESVDYSFDDKAEIKIQKLGIPPFIQTDKPQYKPGQTVQFRVMTLNSELKPIMDPLTAVWIENPTKTRMQQWLDVHSTKGLFSFDMELSDDPVLGDWIIWVQPSSGGGPISKTFKVDEYVLPKYEISIHPPSFVAINAETIEGEVCAKYTYGKPVTGEVALKFCITQSYYSKKRPCVELVEEISGCYKFSVQSSDLELLNSEYPIWGAKLKIEATVTETLTNVNLTTSDESASIERHLLKVDFKPHTPEYFKPGLPFHGKLVVTRPDGSVAGGEQIEISVTHYRIAPYNETRTSNDAGEVLFTLPPVSSELASFTIEARALGFSSEYKPDVYTLHEPRAYHHLKQWFSPTGSFVQIERLEDAVPCGEKADFSISYTTDDNSKKTFHYEVISRGNIVDKGHVDHSFSSADNQPLDGGEREVAERAALLGSGSRLRKSIRQLNRDGVRGPRDVHPGFLPRRHDPESPLPTKATMGTLDHTATFTLSVTIKHQMSPVAHLVVYYIREDGEVVADGIDVDVQKCLQNKVTMDFTPSEAFPGATSSLQLTAAPESLCSVGVVDKSVHVLGGNNQISPAMISAILAEQDIKDSGRSFYNDDLYCELQLRKKHKKEKLGRYYGGMATSDYYDSIHAFKSVGQVAFSDLTVETRPCELQDFPYYYDAMSSIDISPGGLPGAPGAAGMPGPRVEIEEDSHVNGERSGGTTEEEETTLDLRTYFPETWLWNLIDIDESGKHQEDLEVPHTITDWVGGAFCTNVKQGLGVSELTTLRAFQPFFLSFTLPYSIVRGEKIKVPVSVFNYLDKCLVISVQMESTSQVQVLTPGEEDGTYKLCVCGSKAKTANFYVEATELGMVNLTAKATSVENEDWRCDNLLVSALDNVVSDAATRQILVEPEGIEQEYTYSNFACPTDKAVEVDKKLVLPSVGLVEGSQRGLFSVIGDVMGASLSNLDSLLRLPTGCGEQNMLKFAPNIFVMQYLSATGQDSEQIREKAIGFMKTGYQRELTYRHDDGSYSAFGNNDASGSTWLTAFVVRSFAQARQFIFIDESDLEQSVEWFRRNQKENGCFRQVGKVLHKGMKGGLSSGDNDVGLTAFVLMALIETGMDTSDEMIASALSCLREQQSAVMEDLYTTALITYVYGLVGSPEEKAMMSDIMTDEATEQDGMMFWSKEPEEQDESEFPWSYPPQSANVEITAYALMAKLKIEESSAISVGLPIVKWLSSQRNSYGGFGSTQDTVVGLQALAQYATITYSDGGLDLTVTVTDQYNTADMPTFSVDESNSLLLQQHPLRVPNILSFIVDGSGCALVQANVKYNINPDELVGMSEPSFDLNVQVQHMREELPTDHCSKRRLAICAKFLSDEPSNMAVVEVKMQTGWIPDKLSLMELKKKKDILKRYEVDRNLVNLYFDQFDKTAVCVDFVVEEEMEVDNAKEAYVHVYDYYQTELSLTQNYAIQRTCGTKEELPNLTPEEFERLNNEGFEGQMRMPEEPFPGVLPNLDSSEELAAAGCPQCHTERPDNYRELLCASQHAYKSVVKSGKIRILSDFREVPKSVFDSTIYVPEERLFDTEKCSCPMLADLSEEKNINTRVLILVSGEGLQKNKVGFNMEYSLNLDEKSVVMPLDDDRPMRRAIRNCNRKKRRNS